MSGPAVNKVTSEIPPTPEKKFSIAELKNGKVIFRQKPVSFEKQSETLQEIVKFREMLEERINKQEPPLSSFPEEHKPLIAKLAHESDKSLITLSKHIHQELLPTLDEDDDKNTPTVTAALPLNIVENAIKAVLIRNNYGLDAPLGVKLPAIVSVWRWDVRSEHFDWLPKNSREKAESRLADRVQARDELKKIFEALPQEDRDAIIDPRGATKLPTKELNLPKPETSSVNLDIKADENKPSSSNSKKLGKKKADDVENDTADAKAGRPKKVQDPEKVAKEKERLEKKAARVEREQKEKDAQNKSKSIMAKFFAKPKVSSRLTPTINESAVAGPSRIQSDFEKVFKPFVLHKDKTIAPVNWFVDAKKRKRRATSHLRGAEMIVIDSDEEADDIEMHDAQPTEQKLRGMNSKERLQDILGSLPTLSQSRSRRKASLQLKTYHPVVVRDLIAQLSEAEIGGNDDLVREILLKLSDRTLLPAKVLIFHEDPRPGYFGTWTRSSQIIGSRTPFAKDTLVFDYAYDSGEEWEEEPAGDADDVVEDGEDEDGGDEDPDSDLDSWLVDDDDEPEVTIHDKNSPPPIFDFPAPLPKRKAEDADKKAGKKRKVVLPLTPFAKGPSWETTIGQCQYDAFKPYMIQLFNDTPYPINPFTYVSTCVEDHRASKRAANPGGANEDVFAVPALPPRLAVLRGTESSNPSSLSTPVPGVNPPKKAAVSLKSSFPDMYLTLLFNKITQLQASSINALVESIYLELREHKVKKIAIEAKVREVGEKCKEKRVWVVKPALMHTQVS
ncbi:hypothetical protein B0H34DRAFT_299811 [Crassisporium funariophilum]|nr:hypothetical protein B0H34DRAFT_299811 [Crassisporium funariophilum]